MSWQDLLIIDRFKRAQAYDPEWVARNQMGPNALWLTEWLCEELELRPGMRVLDLGCGSAMSSIFLAREFGVRVHAVDLWVNPAANWARIQEAGVADLVTPVQADARRLPFAPGYFDLILSVDAYPYFGTDTLYLSYLARFLAPGGQIAVAVPGLTRELDGPPPKHLTEPQSNGTPFWEPDCWVFHSADWWRTHWERSGLVDIRIAEPLEDGHVYWARQEHAFEQAGISIFPSCAESLEADAGRTIALVRVIARLNESGAGVKEMPHVWEPAFENVCSDLFAARNKMADDAKE